MTSPRVAMQLAHKLRSARPGPGEGDFADATWRRCVHIVAESGAVNQEDERAFLVICGIEPE